MCRDKIDRRRFLRIKFPFTIHLYPIGEAPISAYTEDISPGGIKVAIRQGFEVSSLIKLEVYVRLKPISCMGKITWVNERESDFLEGETFYDIGIEFLELKSEEKDIIKERIGKITQDRKVKTEIEN